LDLAVLPTGKKISLPNLTIYRPPRLLKLDNVPVGASWAKLIYDMALSFYTLMLALTRRYAAIHGIEEGAIIASALGQITNTPAICDMDSYFPEQLSGTHFFGLNFIQKGAERIFSWAASHSSLIIAVCEALALQARDIAPHVPISRIEDIPLSEHRTGMQASQDALDSEALELRYGLKERIVALYTGNLQKYQGIDLLLASWQWLNQQPTTKDALLVIVGGNANEIESYRKLSRRMGIEETVVWTGQRPVAEMDAWMALADILVSPRSLGDNTPLKIFSYMASGKVVVATRRPTHTQVLDESEAYLAEPDASDFGRAMMNALSRKADAQQRAVAAQEKIKRHYNYESFRSKLLTAYNLVLKKSSPGHSA
jgi:glycosyltransferase involved in cell wall biosynthesis